MGHNAGEQLLGYLYQIQYALFLLLDSDDSNAQISIEKFDDIAFEQDGTPIEMIQTKHHGGKSGNLTDASVDLWRTLKAWIDAIGSDEYLVETTRFVIMTTALAPEKSAAALLNPRRSGEDCSNQAYQILKNVAESSKNESNAPFYDAFLASDERLIKRMLSKSLIITGAPHIQDIEQKISKALTYACSESNLGALLERLEGKWTNSCIKALMSDQPTYLAKRKLDAFIRDVAQQYKDDNLPIDINPDAVDELLLDEGRKEMFVRQLELIACGSRRVRIARKDYYRAFSQRSNWLRDGLVDPEEIDRYEERLFDEWEHCFAAMADRVDDESTEDFKCEIGQDLYCLIENKDINIRPQCCDYFIMRGSYHILADCCRIGWYVDYADCLNAKAEDAS